MAGYKRRLIASEEKRALPLLLGALKHRGVDVFCWCNRCGHSAVMATAQLIGQLGAEIPVPEIGTRMRCSSCGSKDVATRPAWPSQGRISRHG